MRMAAVYRGIGKIRDERSVYHNIKTQFGCMHYTGLKNRSPLYANSMEIPTPASISSDLSYKQPTGMSLSCKIILTPCKL